MIQIADSLGNTFLDANGTGRFSIIQNNGNIENGEYLEGFKTGLWKSYNAKLNETYEDNYLENKFINGRTISADGNTLDYDILETLPTFNGGINSFGKFLAKNLNYPPRARDSKQQGRVYVAFAVEKTGELNDIRVIRGVSPELNKEALRVMLLSPNWIPGMRRGKLVKVSYTVPIFFKLP